MSRTVIATTTFYPSPDDPRIVQALETFEALDAAGYTTCVVDGGSKQSFIDAARALPCIRIEDEKERGMGAGRRQAMRMASFIATERASFSPGFTDGGVVLWMEPEKTGLVPFIADIVRPLERHEADLVLPARRSMASYPVEQEYAERLGNKAFTDLTGHALDAWFGPRAIRPAALKFFLDYDGKSADGKEEYGDKWDSIFVPVLRAIADGLTVTSVDVGYIHPAQQKLDEEGNIDMLIKRIAQLQNLVPMLRDESRALQRAASPV